MISTIEEYKKQAFDSSIRESFESIVEELRTKIGTKLVAYIVGVNETRAVREWAEGKRVPSSDTQDKIRFLFRIVNELERSEGLSIVSPWLQGMNPHLDDRSPARVLREGDFEQEATKILFAAEAFMGA